MFLLFYTYGWSREILTVLMILRLVAYSGEPPLHWAVTPELYGFRNIGKISGIINTSVMIASTIAPIVGGVIRDIASSYRYVILSSAISSSVALLSLAILLKLYRKKRNKL